MSISPDCSKCAKELNEFGAILLSPPDRHNEVHKFHLCKGCYKGMAVGLNCCD